MTGTIPIWATLLIAVIGSGGFGAFVPWLLNRLDHRPTAAQKSLEERLDRIEARYELQSEGMRVLLRCKLEKIETDMVNADGVCDLHTKASAETIYNAYAALGGNGLGTQMINDIRNAHIEPNDSQDIPGGKEA